MSAKLSNESVSKIVDTNALLATILRGREGLALSPLSEQISAVGELFTVSKEVELDMVERARGAMLEGEASTAATNQHEFETPEWWGWNVGRQKQEIVGQLRNELAEAKEILARGATMLCAAEAERDSMKADLEKARAEYVRNWNVMDEELGVLRALRDQVVAMFGSTDLTRPNRPKRKKAKGRSRR